MKTFSHFHKLLMIAVLVPTCLTAGCGKTDSSERAPARQSALILDVSSLNEGTEFWIRFSGPAFPDAAGKYNDKESALYSIEQFSRLMTTKRYQEGTPINPPTTLSGVSEIRIGWKEKGGTTNETRFTFNHQRPHVDVQQLNQILNHLDRRHQLGYKSID